MKIEEINGITVIKADEGKLFRRIEDGVDFGNEIWLGKAYIIGDTVLKEPKDEKPSDFIEYDAPIEKGVEDESSI